MKIKLSDIHCPPVPPPPMLMNSMRVAGLIRPVNIVEEDGKYYTTEEAGTVEAARKLGWSEIECWVNHAPSGYSKDSFVIRMKGHLAQADFGSGPVGKILRSLRDEYIVQFKETEKQFAEFVSVALKLPHKIIKKAIEEPEDNGVSAADFYGMLNEVKRARSSRYKDLTKLRICPLCGWQSEKLDLPKEVVPVIVKEVLTKRLDHLLKNTSKRDKLTAVSLLLQHLNQMATELKN